MKIESWGGLGAACLILAACVSNDPPPAPEPVVITREVLVPTPIACNPALPPEPAYPDTDAAIRDAPGPADMLLALAAGRLLRIQREAELNAALAGCAGNRPGTGV